MPIPTKGFFDPDPAESDSLQQRGEDKAAFKAEFDRQDKEQEQVNAKFKAEEEERQSIAREQDISNLSRYADLARDPMTRDLILARIRRMREEKPKEIEPPPLSEYDRKRLEKEQAEGRAALARVQAAMTAHLPVVEEKPDTTPVHHPNPSQDEIYPTVKSTLPPKPRR
jgi:chromatin segregation and condensation protein Rec8/ScpA/Scc1 (kleisin family)